MRQMTPPDIDAGSPPDVILKAWKKFEDINGEPITVEERAHVASLCMSLFVTASLKYETQERIEMLLARLMLIAESGSAEYLKDQILEVE